MDLLRNARTGILILIGTFFMTMANGQDDYTNTDAQEAYTAGKELLDQEKYEEALAKLIQCVEICDVLESEDLYETREEAANAIPNIQYSIASKYLQDSDLENGLPALEKALELADEYNNFSVKTKTIKNLSGVYFTYGNNLTKDTKYDEADEYYNKILALDPDFARAYLAKAYMYKLQGKNEDFKKSMLSALEIAQRTNDRRTESMAKKQGYGYFLKLGAEAFSGDKIDESVEMLNSAMEFDSEQADAYFLLMQAYLKKSNWDNAIEAGKKALEFEEDSDDKKARIYFEMGNAYKEKGENDSACQNYKKAMFGNILDNAKYQREQILKCTD